MYGHVWFDQWCFFALKPTWGQDATLFVCDILDKLVCDILDKLVCDILDKQKLIGILIGHW